MSRSHFVLILFATLSNPTMFLLDAQTRPSSAVVPDDTQRRTEKAVARQRMAVAAMAESIASQQSSVARQRHNSHFAGSVDFQPAHNPSSAVTVAQCHSLPPGEIDALVDTAAERTSVAPELIRSVMRQESDFRACAVSAKGAMGLMQLLPSTADDLGVQDAFDPEANVLGGARLLRQLMDRYGGDLSLTLSAYNAGPGRVDQAAGMPMIPETIDYVTQILAHLSSARRLQPEGENTATAVHSARDNAPDTNLWLMETDEGE